MNKQYCPICKTPVGPSTRYPQYVCESCADRATSPDGRLLSFANADLSGGFIATYADTQQLYQSHECFIDGIKCKAGEARFGGIVIQPVADKIQ